MIKVSNLVEQIFATAVSLDQSGGLKNTIYAIEDNIFILNYDHTVLIRFRLRKSENVFTAPVSFKANDYDSDMFEQKGNQIVFYSETAHFQRKKICGTTDMSPEEVRDLFENYYSDDAVRQTVQIPSELLSLLDDSLSHVEFSGEEGEGIRIIQRNIYSGGIIEIQEKQDGLFGAELDMSFGPMGIKTGDLSALFTFQDVLNFAFPPLDSSDFIIVSGTDKNKRDMVAIVSGCLYDEIIELQTNKKEEQNHGRQKQKIGRGEQETDSTPETKIRRRSK